MLSLKVSKSRLCKVENRVEVYYKLIGSKEFSKQWLQDKVLGNDEVALSIVKKKERIDKINEIIKD